MRLLAPVIVSLSALLLFGHAADAAIFTDWTSVDVNNDVAQGTLGQIGVTMSGGDLTFGVTNGSSGAFNYPSIFCPSIPASDFVEFIGTSPAYAYTITFSEPVLDPILHIVSLASTLTFSGTTVTKLCGQTELEVSGTQISGDCVDGVTPNDANGTVRVNGLVSSISFTAVWEGCLGFTRDGIDIQIGADEAVGVPFGPSSRRGSWGSLKALYR